MEYLHWIRYRLDFVCYFQLDFRNTSVVSKELFLNLLVLCSFDFLCTHESAADRYAVETDEVE